ncbi:cytochrome c3 family protein [Stratiformator vulcanicus]|nr:cytochrome c3 family protein [Stratiformator vulcanicus]
MDRFLFPAWVNSLVVPTIGAIGIGAIYLGGLAVYGASPANLVTGYKPEQPVPFSHKLHSGKMKIDCRYCHTAVEHAAHSNIPATSTCANCHSNEKDAAGQNALVAVHTNSPKLVPVRESLATGAAVEWDRVHDLPDYAYFNHSAHVARGVSCVSCHGRVDTMEVVERVSPLNMAWCLNCHRNPYPNIRPVDEVTNLAWQPPEGKTAEEFGRELAELHGIKPNTDCSTCHR